MKLADNNGNDSTNENVHNYLVQSYARGGIVHIVLLIFLIYLFYFIGKEITKL